LLLLLLLLLRAHPQLQETAATGNLLQGLSAALQHPHLSTHPQVLCSAAGVCKDWRQAVQQCSACNTAVMVDATMPLPQLHSFAQWLARHTGLFRKHHQAE
jgi:hypothetical protein